MNIAVITGGNSSEHAISVKSAGEVKKWLEQTGFVCYLVIIKGTDWTVKFDKQEYPVDKNYFGFKNGKEYIRFNYAYNIIHGTPGEDGKIQGYLETMKIPYSGSGILSSSLTFNKYACKTFLKQHNILTAEAGLIRKGHPYDLEKIIENIGLPCFIKPNNGGSSFGITKVNHHDNLEAALQTAFKEDDEVILETYIKGIEVTCGVLKTRKEEFVFPVTEIVTRNEFFDFEAKYTTGKADEITPARINNELFRKCQQLASTIYDLTFSKGLVRVDFIIKGNQLYFLELNSVPGMTSESIIPKQIRAMGLEEKEILRKIVLDEMFEL
ncbi:MAG: D-alanine--D-alanine ligase [Bacteroidales bacterium]|nr:D-alanine--D-alanine ligase [Bacteroidales bacterium]MBN2698209.1 D-alanine--D-alanine ligase [Bacteroidales bacterium]